MRDLRLLVLSRLRSTMRNAGAVQEPRREPTAVSRGADRSALRDPRLVSEAVVYEAVVNGGRAETAFSRFVRSRRITWFALPKLRATAEKAGCLLPHSWIDARRSSRIGGAARARSTA